jgi:hypothetical protein
MSAYLRSRRGGVYRVVIVGSLLLALASLAYPSAPAYDPWAWIIWGREILHGHLVTTGGPTWKPLPVIFTTLFAPFGGAAPGLWLVVARAGGIMAVGLSSVLAFRLAAPGRVNQATAAVLAGAGVALLAGFPDSVALGESEGLLIAVIMLAVLRHLDGVPRQALALGFTAGLIRPETWPFLGLYAVLVWRRDPQIRAAVVAGLAMVGALWFLPELWGSGSVTRGVAWAQNVRTGSPALAQHPFWAEISTQAWPLIIPPFKVGLAILAALVGFAGKRLGGKALALGAVGLIWVLEEAVLTQLGFSGSDRYLLAPAALVVVAGAVGWARLLASAQAVRVARVAPATGLCLVVFAAAIPWQGTHMARVTHTATELRDQAMLWRDLRLAVSEAGGSQRLIDCGAIQTNPSEVPLAAWTLGVQLRRTESGDGNVMIETGPMPSPHAHYRVIARVKTVSILVRCQSEPRLRAATRTPPAA